MLLALLILTLISVGGAALTYLFDREETFLWRLAAGNAIGSVLFGLIVLLLACLAGFSIGTVLLAGLLTFGPPLFLLRSGEIGRRFRYDRQVAKGKFEGAGFKKFYRFLYYAAIFILLWLFFDQAMIVNDRGIFTGASQNYGDLPFHLGVLYSFAEGQNFPPENPSFAGAGFAYPFVADLVAAALYKIGASAQNAFFLQNLLLGFALVVLLERFVFRLTGSGLAGKIAPLLLVFGGGLGFGLFFRDYWQGSESFFAYLGALPRDYTINNYLRWGNPLVVLFITQRSLLLGMPLALVVLGFLWKIFAGPKDAPPPEKGGKENRNTFFSRISPAVITGPLVVGLLAGTLPLVHAHSLLVLFVVAAFLFLFRPDRWPEWIAFGAGTALAAVPLLVWITAGSASDPAEFIDWHFGWDKRDNNFFWFWLTNTGLFIPLLIAGIIRRVAAGRDAPPPAGKDEKTGSRKKRGRKKKRPADAAAGRDRFALVKFYLPFAVLFVVGNAVKLAPWEWDNIKVLIYWFVGSLPFVAGFLAWLWNRDRVFKIVAAGCLLVLTLSGALDVWRTISGEIRSRVFDRDAVEIAARIRRRTRPDALFLNAPTFNTAIVLTGRRSLMRYPGHLSSHGIDYAERQSDLRRIYAGDGTADIFLRKYGIDYVLISPELRAYAANPNNNVRLNEKYFEKYEKFLEVGPYQVYKVK